jgi:hypothetical protein
VRFEEGCESNKREAKLAKKAASIIPIERIQQCIYLVRKQKVMLDKDLAALYGVQTRDLNKAVSRNLDRFPKDFMFGLTKAEFENLKFHFGTSSWGSRRFAPFVSTDKGIAMQT